MRSATPHWTWSSEFGCLRPSGYTGARVSAEAVPLSELLAWTRKVLPGPIDHQSVRSRPWSLSARITSTSETYWVKANAAGLAHEGPLLAELARAGHGDLLVEHVAHDQDRGFLLTRDGGATVRQGELPLEKQWRLVMERHRESLDRFAPHVDAAAGLGVPDLSGERLLDHWLLAVDAAGDPRLDQHALTVQEQRAARALVPELQRLAASCTRTSLDHGDAHPGNLLSAGQRFLDLGDAALVDADLALANTRRRAKRELRQQLPLTCRDQASDGHSSHPLDERRNQALLAVRRCDVWLRLPATARRQWPQYLPASVRDAVLSTTTA